MENNEIKEKEEIKENNEMKEEKVLLEEFKKYKENSVSKEKYEKDLKAQKERADLYLDAIVNGKEVDTSSNDNVSLEEKVREISKFKGTNLDFWTKMTSAVDTLLNEMPQQEILKITGEDGLEELIKVNEGMKQMVKDSNKNPDAFLTYYNTRVAEGSQRMGNAIESAGGIYNYLSKNQAKK